MFNAAIKIAIAAVIAGLVVFAASASPKAGAADAASAPAAAKGDRLAFALRGTACSRHGWPNFERKCQFDVRMPANEARTVRVLALR